ncbi:MAG: molybdenum cofactor biosynthesis protein MoaE [Alphaproteobacteria bacterium]|jgi:molybdopterin synthase catalytic subunit|nr:molybdenum cofactor biosynthesis protein MoaE [Alphaproteobacteria bacterium]PPR14343.1 MAG: Molybdopterin synthase catalytic subunit [Alphaproteobacteria bacterium MarineAlpha12_Bin1]|tara:strand:+ start:4133 stop:4591 length:459 start_codon:yes stop_codon:yes gene_type:complete
MIKVQKEDFDISKEIEALASSDGSIGAVSSFVGLVRDQDSREVSAEALKSITLEHYPAMTEKKLLEIEIKAKSRWNIKSSIIIHRYGRLEPGEKIVFVACASKHRQDAFDACNFLMDWLKTEAPFWKLEESQSRKNWVKKRESDDKAAERWK